MKYLKKEAKEYAFEHMKEYCIAQTQASSSLLSYSHLPILQMNIVKAKDNFSDNYQAYMRVLYNTSLIYFKKRNLLSKINDFHSFMECFMDFSRRFNSMSVRHIYCGYPPSRYVLSISDLFN